MGPAELMAIADALAADAAPRRSAVGTVGRDWELLAATDRFEAFVISWAPGGSIQLHDHGDCAGAVAVIDGELLETAVVEHERKVLSSTTNRVPAGGSLFFAGRHVHDIVNRQGTVALSVHVYAPRLTSMTHYRLDGDALLVDRTERYDRGVLVG